MITTAQKYAAEHGINVTTARKELNNLVAKKKAVANTIVTDRGRRIEYTIKEPAT